MKKLIISLIGLIAGALFISGADGAFSADGLNERNFCNYAGLLTNEQTSEADAFSEPEYFGRAALSTLENAQALVFAYDQISAGIEKSAESINVYDGVHPITKDEIICVFNAYRYDRTEHFWLGNTYTISSTVTSVVSLRPSYIMSGDELNAAQSEFDAAVSELLLLVDGQMSEFERELVLHDALAERIVYTLDAPNAHNAYGALVEGEAVCEGYAEALAYLLFKSGIQSFIATGSSLNPSTGEPEGHAWNIVRIDGEYYHTDLTWNDQGENLFHAYFNVTDARISEDHNLDSALYALPECNSSSANYFSVKEGALSSYDAQIIGKFLGENALKAHVYINGDVAEFINWYQDNIRSIASSAGITSSFSYGYARLGRELILSLTPSVAIKKISLTVDTGLALNYYVSAEDMSILNSGALGIRFDFAGMVHTVTEYEIIDGEYVFTLDGIFYHQMCEEINAELVLIRNGTLLSGNEYRSLGTKDGISVEKYCLELLEIYKTDIHALNLASSLLAVGAEAQKHLNYKTDKLPADGAFVPPVDLSPTEKDGLRILGNDNESFYIKNVFLIYDGIYEGGFKICIDVFCTPGVHVSIDTSAVIISEEEKTEGVPDGVRRYVLESERVLGFDNFKLASISSADVEIELVFSLNSCVYEILNGAGNAEISDGFARALYCLGRAADTYAYFTSEEA